MKHSEHIKNVNKYNENLRKQLLKKYKKGDNIIFKNSEGYKYIGMFVTHLSRPEGKTPLRCDVLLLVNFNNTPQASLESVEVMEIEHI